MNRITKAAVGIVRMGVGVALILKTTNYMFGTQPPPFKTQDDAQMHMLIGLLWLGSVLGWFLLTLYLFPDQHTKQDALGRWLEQKGLAWRVS